MRPNGKVISIDGPAGTGKSSVGRAVAEKLGYEFDHEYIAYEVDRTRRVH